MNNLTSRGPERRSGVDRRTAGPVRALKGKRDRRSGKERRSGKDRRRYNRADLLEAVRAVRAEFWRLPQDPDAVSNPGGTN